MARQKRQSIHYVNNADFSQAVVEYVTRVNEARENNKDIPLVTDYIAQCFLRIAEGLSHKSNFIRYTYREEMVMDAVENSIKAIMNYDINKATRTGLPNAFAYFTQISYYAFLRRIAKEKRQQDIKELYIDYAGAGAFMDTNQYSDSDSIIERIRTKTQAIRERDNKLKEFGKKIKNKAKRKVVGPMDEFLKD